MNYKNVNRPCHKCTRAKCVAENTFICWDGLWQCPHNPKDVMREIEQLKRAKGIKSI